MNYSLIFELLTFCLQTNVSTCVQGSPHLGQVRVFFFPPPVPLLEDPLDGTVSFEGGVGSVGALPKLPLIVRALLATMTLTILCTARNGLSLDPQLSLRDCLSFLAIMLFKPDRICLQIVTHHDWWHGWGRPGDPRWSGSNARSSWSTVDLGGVVRRGDDTAWTTYDVPLGSKIREVFPHV